MPKPLKRKLIRWSSAGSDLNNRRRRRKHSVSSQRSLKDVLNRTLIKGAAAERRAIASQYPKQVAIKRILDFQTNNIGDAVIHID